MNINYGGNVANVSPPQQLPKANTWRKWLGWLAIAVIILLIIAGAAAFYLIYNQSSVVIEDQPLGKTIAVKKLVLRSPGFLGISVANRYGKPASNIGATEYLLPDTYTDFTVDLSESFLNSNSSTGQLVPGKFLYATIYEDSDGSKVLSSGDQPAKDFWGRSIVKKFKIK